MYEYPSGRREYRQNQKSIDSATFLVHNRKKNRRDNKITHPIGSGGPAISGANQVERVDFGVYAPGGGGHAERKERKIRNQTDHSHITAKLLPLFCEKQAAVHAN